MVACALLCRLCLLCSCFAILSTYAASGSDIIIEFEPMGAMNVGSIASAISQELKSASSAPSSMRGTAKGGRESELDDFLSTVLQPPTSNLGPSGFSEGEVQKSRYSMPGMLVRDLFPGPLGPMVVQEPHPQPFSEPDPFIMDIVKSIDNAFANDIMPAVHKAISQERTPASCEQDIKHKCQGAKSYLHCLGDYPRDHISNECVKDVGQSVPFLCSQAISTWCNVLEEGAVSNGILSCLQGHMDTLDGQCKDALLTTQHVIDKVNTHKASLVDPTTGGKKVSRPELKSGAVALSIAATAKMREANLDAKLGIAPSAEQKAPEAASYLVQPPPHKAITVQKALPIRSQPMAAPSDEDSEQSPYIMMRKINVAVLFLTIVGLVGYMIVSQGSTVWSEVHAALVQQKGPEGIKLISNVELLKSSDI